MTKAFAIALLKQDIQNSKQKISYYHNEVGIEALDLAIKALEQQPSEDCISRQAVLNTLFYKSDNNCEVVLNKELQDRIKALPSVTPQQKMGKWIDVDSLDGALWHECSECGETEFYATDYCPNCGAKMEVEV